MSNLPEIKLDDVLAIQYRDRMLDDLAGAPGKEIIVPLVDLPFTEETLPILIDFLDQKGVKAYAKGAFFYFSKK